ncbi:putative fatty acyl-CoA reductase CG5065 [Bicyclus anynana]|uniref:Fatty acyl-CoA reductase n=1 Tax=Bicyclus anynana TaxID=110368 RepID=A0ABM3LIN2_BICAN|nr:putative fatty acyl-CoA reductase CG5065 [Bicyclus anynana]XP_052738912.1 putative fatty acyl-CoA reductase CG5065 [Bicyclus anynana]
MTSMGVREFYAGKKIFITGATGFMGKVLVEKLLRSCPDVETIYILVRRKKGQSPEARLEAFAKCRAFEKLLEQDAKAFRKVRLVPGDILEDNLGIPDIIEQELQKECQIVVNNAACVSFNLPVRKAVQMNTMGTQKVLQLAEKMKKLEVFLHVSTSFCHDYIDVLEEKIYKAKHNPLDIINMLKWMDDDTLAALQPELIKPYPNTYGYTKSLSEDLVSQYSGKFPIALARPSIVIPAYKEPLAGWTDNINGPSGVIYAASRGVLRSMYCKDSTKVDTVPVDFVINALILLACVTACEKPKDVRVCNITQSGVNEISWVKAAEYWPKFLAKYPLSYSLWYPEATAKNYKLEHQIHVFFFHMLPAYFIDLLLYLLGKKTFMVHVYHKMSHGLEVLEYYNTRTWIFKNDYFKSLEHRVSEEENEIFYTDFSKVVVEEFMENYIKGMREFYCKEDPSTLPEARKLHRRLYYLHVFTKYAFYALCIYFLFGLIGKFL